MIQILTLMACAMILIVPIRELIKCIELKSSSTINSDKLIFSLIYIPILSIYCLNAEAYILGYTYILKGIINSSMLYFKNKKHTYSQDDWD